jgi:hypothetical protein
VWCCALTTIELLRGDFPLMPASFIGVNVADTPVHLWSESESTDRQPNSRPSQQETVDSLAIRSPAFLLLQHTPEELQHHLHVGGIRELRAAVSRTLQQRVSDLVRANERLECIIQQLPLLREARCSPPCRAGSGTQAPRR